MGPASNQRHSPRLTRRALTAALGAGALGIAARRGSAARLSQAARQDATPTTADQSAFRDLLRLVPDPYPAASSQATPLTYYADIAGQLVAVGLTPPTDPESEDARLWNRVLLGMALPADIANYARAFSWKDLFGWTT